MVEFLGQSVMSTIRFTLIAVVLFGLTFVGISWANKGFPVMAMKVEPMKPDARIPTFEESVKKGIRKDWENSRPRKATRRQGRDRLRLELLQAANRLCAVAPATATMKKNLVEALSDYTKAWSDMAGCKFWHLRWRRPQDRYRGRELLDAARHARAGSRAQAFEKGGIGKEDFPDSIRL